MLEVARAYEELAEVAGELAKAVKAEDRASGRVRGRARGARPSLSRDSWVAVSV